MQGMQADVMFLTALTAFEHDSTIYASRGRLLKTAVLAGDLTGCRKKLQPSLSSSMGYGD